jgi:hypothetical protein
MTRKPKPVTATFRLPIDLYQAIDVYAEHADLNLSEALRQLVVEALEAHNVKQIVDEGNGPEEDDTWKQPLSAADQDQD